MNNPEEHFYDVEINWKQGRIGSVSSPKLEETLEVATPPEFPGGIEGMWSPEHLFVASVGSCFLTSFTAVAEFSKFEFEDLKVNGSGKMSREDGKFVMSEITLNPVLTIADNKQEKKALRLLEKAEQICLISRSITSKIIFNPQVRIEMPVH